MMIRRSTWFVLLILAVLVAGGFYLKDRKARNEASATPTAGAASTPLFSAADGTPTDIIVKDSTGQSVEVARNDGGAWVLKAPTAADADQAAAEAAATQVTALQVLASPDLGINMVGLDKPQYTMSFTFSSQKKHGLSVGAITPIQDGYYVSLDGGPVRIVDKQGLDALIGLLAQPPYVASATPAVPPASTLAPPTPTIELTATAATPVSTIETPAPTPTP